MRRIDVLGSRSKAIGVMTGAVLADELDPELQTLSQTTGRELDMGMAAVTLVLERVTFMRGFAGLPPELEVARATDRDISFCQLVVRDAALVEINDAKHDPRVPQHMVEKYGLSSYLGAPVSLNGEVVGTMCVADQRPRVFTDVERATLRHMAQIASARLAALALQPRARERALHDRAVRPVFGELRNRLMPLIGNVAAMEAALAELEASQRLVRYAKETGQPAHLDLLTHSDNMFAELAQCMMEVAADVGQIHRSIIALERATLVNTPTCSLADVIDAAGTLAFHRTKLVAGVAWAGERAIALDTVRPVAITVLAAALGSLSEALYSRRGLGGIAATICLTGTSVVLRLEACLPEQDHHMIANQLEILVGDTPDVGVDAADNCVQIRLAARAQQLAA